VAGKSGTPKHLADVQMFPFAHRTVPGCCVNASFCTLPEQNLAWKTSNFAELPSTRRQSEARNFEKAQHIDKQNPGVSSTINALKQQQTWAHHPTGI